TGGLSQSDPIIEVRISKSCIVIERIVNGMVRTAAIFATVTNIQRRDAEVLEERREIRARAEGTDPQIRACSGVAPIVRTTFDYAISTKAFAHGDFLLWI